MNPQKLILMHLSSVELLQCFLTGIRVCSHEIGQRRLITNFKLRVFNHYIKLAYHALLLPFFMCLFMLTQDRFLVVYLNMKYSLSRFNAYKNKFIGLGWILCSLYVIIVVTITEVTIQLRSSAIMVIPKIFPSLSCVIIIQFFLFYIYTVYVIRRLNKRQRRRINYKLLLPFLIILTFIIFKGIPDVLLMFFKMVSLAHYIDIGIQLNLISDSLCYILVQPSIRKRFARRIRTASTTLGVTLRSTSPYTMSENYQAGVVTQTV